MNRLDYILNQLAQECNEIGQVASKAALFGLDSVHPGKPELGTNIQRMREELTDLLALFEMVDRETGGEFGKTDRNDAVAMTAKLRKVEKYMGFSREIGKLTQEHRDYGDAEPTVTLTREGLNELLENASLWDSARTVMTYHDAKRELCDELVSVAFSSEASDDA